ncbi:hypothetical protein RvY_11336 [Ramazzottius varieornatus]|uniref:Uncharacterized protein n=1 Tax=Ramazzottius varieornatus TaxID=947166 RepID=A0A1D1VFQ9_RAMVA|nr:hypothetical protein RvY_11336 [Ramazzottius varieornatus]
MQHQGAIGAWCTVLYKKYFQKNSTSLRPSILHHSNNKDAFDERYTSQFKNSLDFRSYASCDHPELATRILSISPHAAGVERLWSRIDAQDTTKHGKSALSETEDGVLEIIQTAGPSADQELEGESQVNAEISAINTQFDEFLTDAMEDELTDDDDGMVVPLKWFNWKAYLEPRHDEVKGIQGSFHFRLFKSEDQGVKLRNCAVEGDAEKELVLEYNHKTRVRKDTQAERQKCVDERPTSRELCVALSHRTETLGSPSGAQTQKVDS